MSSPTFADYYPSVPGPGEQDLNAKLPVPPMMFVGGQRYDLERVKLHDLEAWRQRLGLRLARVSWCGRLGWVSIYGRKDDDKRDAI